MKKRILSATVLILILLPIIYFGGLYYYIALGIISLLAYKEVICLPSFENVPNIVKVFGVIFYLPIIFCYLMSESAGNLNFIYIILLFIYMLVPSLFYSEKDYKIKDGMYLTAVMIFLAIGFSSLLYARESLEVFIYLISIAILSDTFAMITGKLIGRHKLCTHISPNKTVEGSLGGLLLGTCVPLIIYNYLVGDITSIIVIMTIAIAVFSQIGDLIFSRIKRENDIKDFSNLIPGHGGVLDRLDSIIFVSLIYFIFSIL